MPSGKKSILQISILLSWFQNVSLNGGQIRISTYIDKDYDGDCEKILKLIKYVFKD